ASATKSCGQRIDATDSLSQVRRGSVRPIPGRDSAVDLRSLQQHLSAKRAAAFAVSGREFAADRVQAPRAYRQLRTVSRSGEQAPRYAATFGTLSRRDDGKHSPHEAWV